MYGIKQKMSVGFQSAPSGVRDSQSLFKSRHAIKADEFVHYKLHNEHGV